MLIGRYRPVTANGDLLLFVREHESERTLVGLNLGGDAIDVRVPDDRLRGGILVSSTGARDGAVVAGPLTRSGDEGVVMALASDVLVPECRTMYDTVSRRDVAAVR